MVIHTANMIPGDWENMTQAVWVSPLLPLKDGIQNQSQSQSQTGGVGSGARFKRDLLAYLNAYGPRKTGSLVSQLARYDFSGVRAALVASVPSKKKVNEMDSDREALWGWPSLKDTLRHVPAKSQEKTPHIVVQVGSPGLMSRLTV